MTTATHYQHLNAGHDTNGNPRRVFVLYDATGAIVRAIDEGYCRTPAELRTLIQLPGFDIKPADYRTLLRSK